MIIIRNIRKEKNITLSDVSKATGYTKSYISQIERGIKQPSIESLRKICDYLKIPVNITLANYDGNIKEKDCIIIEKNNCKQTSYSYENCDESVTVKTLSPEQGISGLRAYVITIPPGSSISGRLISHPYEELMYVLKGKVEAHINNERYTINTQDSLYISPMALHNIYNYTDEYAEVLFTFHD